MRNIILFTGLTLLFFSCTTNQGKSDKNITTEAQKAMIPQSNCFASLSDKDSIWLKVEVFPNVVTGVLKYKISEKDKNEGTLEGKLVGNKLFADYTFISEGIKSVREVAFLIDENTAIEGFGEMEEKNGKFVFKNKSNIDFSKGIKFNRINCVDNDIQFQIK
ncbi:hypothetical protein D9M68_589560 [compost metagenome]